MSKVDECRVGSVEFAMFFWRATCEEGMGCLTLLMKILKLFDNLLLFAGGSGPSDALF